jgi:Reverse transcriptase (RNA-dependent DNA polymerase)
MAQKYLRRWIFVKAFGRYLCTKILKTVNRSSRQMEYTHRHVFYMEQGMLRICGSVLVVMMDDIESNIKRNIKRNIKSNIKVWWDDCLLHTKTEDDLLATLNFFFKKCQEHGLKLLASKCVLFASTVRCCGRLITKDGVRFDPKNMEALQTMQGPQNGADLVQYIAAVYLDAKHHSQLLEACGASLSRTSESVRG